MCSPVELLLTPIPQKEDFTQRANWTVRLREQKKAWMNGGAGRVRLDEMVLALRRQESASPDLQATALYLIPTAATALFLYDRIEEAEDLLDFGEQLIEAAPDAALRNHANRYEIARFEIDRVRINVRRPESLDTPRFKQHRQASFDLWKRSHGILRQYDDATPEPAKYYLKIVVDIVRSYTNRAIYTGFLEPHIRPTQIERCWRELEEARGRLHSDDLLGNYNFLDTQVRLDCLRSRIPHDDLLEKLKFRADDFSNADRCIRDITRAAILSHLVLHHELRRPARLAAMQACEAALLNVDGIAKRTGLRYRKDVEKLQRVLLREPVS